MMWPLFREMRVKVELLTDLPRPKRRAATSGTSSGKGSWYWLRCSCWLPLPVSSRTCSNQGPALISRQPMTCCKNATSGPPLSANIAFSRSRNRTASRPLTNGTSRSGTTKSGSSARSTSKDSDRVKRAPDPSEKPSGVALERGLPGVSLPMELAPANSAASAAVLWAEAPARLRLPVDILFRSGRNAPSNMGPPAAVACAPRDVTPPSGGAPPWASASAPTSSSASAAAVPESSKSASEILMASDEGPIDTSSDVDVGGAQHVSWKPPKLLNEGNIAVSGSASGSARARPR
mmetsp:Transcript_118890/g.343885  ORF Transcript_118890/g.343885 Transcript_118890/m.343885 type:complete len:292 (+) Transcript_118890:371-1246(+)